LLLLLLLLLPLLLLLLLLKLKLCLRRTRIWRSNFLRAVLIRPEPIFLCRGVGYCEAV
jgi:hypothetical protein